MSELHLGGCRKNNGTYVPIVWDKLIEKYNVTSIIDIGCGYAQSLRYFADKGLKAVGVEGWSVALEKSHAKELVIAHDYTLGAYIPDLDFDMGWCAEFVEHVEAQYIPNFMATFKKCKYVAMTHAFPRQKGYHHVNCQESLYWIDIFAIHGFTYFPDDSIFLRNLLTNPDGTPMDKGGHVRKGLMIFRRNDIVTV